MVHVDASDVAVEAILTQHYNKTDMPFCYFSKWLNPMETRWSIYKRNMYAIF